MLSTFHAFPRIGSLSSAVAIMVFSLTSSTRSVSAQDLFRCGDDESTIQQGTGNVFHRSLTDTLRALFVFAQFTDGDNRTPCDPSEWPDSLNLPAWKDSLLEDTDAPTIDGSISYFWKLMSDGHHILKGTCLDSLITVHNTIADLDTTYSGLAAANHAENDVVDQVMDILGPDALTFDANSDGYFDFMFIYFRQVADTSGAYAINEVYEDTPAEFGAAGESYVRSSAKTYYVGSDSLIVDYECGCWITYTAKQTSTGATAARSLAHAVRIANHEYGHDILGLVGGPLHIDTEGPYGIMDGSYEGTLMSAWLRMKAGWITPIEVTSDTTLVLADVALNAGTGVAKIATQDSTQYFLLEARNQTSTRYSQALGAPGCRTIGTASGLLITHIVDPAGVSGLWFDPELSTGLYDSTGVPDPVSGTDRLEFYRGDEIDTTVTPHLFLHRDSDLYKPTSSVPTGNNERPSNVFAPYTNPNTNLYDTPGPSGYPSDQDIYTGITVYNIEWANPASEDSMRVSIRFDGTTPPAGAYKIDANTTWDGRVQLSGDVRVAAGDTLTITDYAEVVPRAGVDSQSAGEDTTLTEVRVTGTVLVQGQSGTMPVLTSSRDDTFVHFWGPGEAAAAAAGGDWTGIYVVSQGSLDMDYADERYATRGVEVLNSDDVTIENSTIGGFSQRGVSLDGSDAAVRYCTITGDSAHAKRGVSSTGANHVSWPTIVGNTISQARYGVYLIGSDSAVPAVAGPAVVDSNVIAQAGSPTEWYGIWVGQTNDYDNVGVQANEVGPAAKEGIHLESCTEVGISECNRIIGADVGLGTFDSQGRVSGNLIFDSGTFGVKVNGSSPVGDYPTPVLGDSAQAGTGGNNIFGSDSMEVWVAFGAGCKAMNNWWGTDSPDSSWFSPLVQFVPFATSAFSACDTSGTTAFGRPGPGEAVADGTGGSMRREGGGTIEEFLLGVPRPNPSAAGVGLKLAVPGGAQGRLLSVRVYDVRGRLVRSLFEGPVPSSGVYRVDWDGRDSRGAVVASGVYFAVTRAGDWTGTRKVVRIGR